MTQMAPPRRARLLAGIWLAAVAATPAAAREVEVARLTAAGFAQDAANLNVAVSAPPGPSGFAITVEAPPATDHETLRLGTLCSLYKVINPMAAILKLVAAEASTPGGPALAVNIAAARSMSRCVLVGELKGRCITRTSVSGSVARAAGDGVAPVSATVERDTAIGGFCEDLSRGIGVVSREAAQQFLAAAIAAAKAPPAAPPT